MNLLDLRSIMGCPGEHEQDPIQSLSMHTRAFRANFSLSFPKKDIVMGKKIVVLCLDVKMIVFFPRNTQ